MFHLLAANKLCHLYPILYKWQVASTTRSSTCIYVLCIPSSSINHFNCCVSYFVHGPPSISTPSLVAVFIPNKIDKVSGIEALILSYLGCLKRKQPVPWFQHPALNKSRLVYLENTPCYQVPSSLKPPKNQSQLPIKKKKHCIYYHFFQVIFLPSFFPIQCHM